MQLLRDMHIVHCDIKPENILLQNLHSPAIKLIDFGSACATKHQMHTYIQSRFYRSPEVLLGCSYGGAIDMWSLGAIVGELFLGLPLFPGESEYNQLFRIVQMRGPMPDSMISAGSLAHKFFAPPGSGHSNGNATPPAAEAHIPQQAVAPSSHFRFKTEAEYCRELSCPPCRNKQYFKHTELPDLIAHHPRLKPLESEAEKVEDRERRGSMLHCLQGLLLIDPSQRWTPRQALRHPFVTGEPFQTELSLPFDAEPNAKPTGSTPSTGNRESDGFASGAPYVGAAAGAPPPVSAAAAVGDSGPAQPMPAAKQSQETPTVQPPSAAAPAEAQPPVQSQPQPVQGVWNGVAPHMIPMCYSPGMAYSRSPPAYHGSPLCALSPPSMQTLSIAMMNSPSQSVSVSPLCMYGCSSPPVRPDGHVNRGAITRPGASCYVGSPPVCAPCYGGACCGEEVHVTPQMVGECGECGGQCLGGSLPQHRASMSFEGQHCVCPAEARNALQYAPGHVEGGQFVYGHPSYEQGEYVQQQYFMPGPPAALPTRLAVNTGSSNGIGQRHSRGERKRNGSKGLQRQQQPTSPPSETGPGAAADGANEQKGLLPLASQNSETGVLQSGDNGEPIRLSFNEVRLSRSGLLCMHAAPLRTLVQTQVKAPLTVLQKADDLMLSSRRPDAERSASRWPHAALLRLASCARQRRRLHRRRRHRLASPASMRSLRKSGGCYRPLALPTL